MLWEFFQGLVMEYIMSDVTPEDEALARATLREVQESKENYPEGFWDDL